MRATIIIDASFCPKTFAGGWAVWISADGFKHKASGQFREPPATNTEAEIKAAIIGLSLAYARGVRTALIQSDCLGVGHDLKRPKGLIRQQRAKFYEHARITFKHVKGHTRKEEARYYVNRWCDDQAKAHMQAMRRGILDAIIAQRAASQEEGQVLE